MNYYYYLAILCTIGIMIFSYLASKKDGEKTVKELNSTTIEQANKIKELTKKNTELTEANISLSKAIHSDTKELTSEGSYPLAFSGGGMENGNKTQMCVVAKGEYAIKNITARVVAIPDYTKVSGLDLRVTGLNAPTINLETLRKSEFKSFMVDTKTKETAIIIYFKSDNLSWNQSIRIVKENDKRYTLSYLKDENGNMLQKKIDDGFPKNKNEEIIIWSNVTKRFEDI